MMATRFTDTLHGAENSDFVTRRRPLGLQLSAIFTVAFLVIYSTAYVMTTTGGTKLFFLTLILTLGSLAWFTIFFVARYRDLILATEFMNAMLASAAQLSTRFCLITKTDGSIVYIDSGFQRLFPHFLRSGSHTIYGLFTGPEITEEMTQNLTALIRAEQNGRIMLPLKDSAGKPMPMLVTIDVLPRPKGYFLFRGRDYIEKRAEGKSEMDTASAMLLAQALHNLNDGVLVTDGDGTITYVNHALEKWLDYAPGEMVSSTLTLREICHHYSGQNNNKVVLDDFEGDVTFLSKNNALTELFVQQKLMRDKNQLLGISAIIRPLAEVKKKLNEVPSAPDELNSAALSDFIASSPLAVCRLDGDGRVLECNASLRELIQSAFPESGWSFPDIVHENDRAEVKALIAKISTGGTSEKKPLELTLATTQAAVTASLYISPIAGGKLQLIAQLIDTSEQKNLEQRFAHSQKMHAVGQLAGGVAHDFNNLLTAMIGFCDLLLMRHPAGDQSFADIMQVKQNANRAANLVRQLLAFSRRQTLQPKMLDITDVLAELSNLIRRLIGENIELKVVHGRDLGMVKADQGQLEQVFINLAVNARDAMHNGGRLTLQTSHVTIASANAVKSDLIPPVEDEAITPGDYVLVEVIDTGTGIPRELLQKIFEPFFSTKEVGSGTGLGLATVYGIVKQTDGFIYVASKEGEGTNFSLFFKRYQQEEAKAVIEAVERPTNDDLTGKGTVLLVEDETPVRTFAARALRNKGYTVLEADCGETAIEVMEKQGSEVDVIITDVIMPGINGPAMIETIAPLFPNVKVVFISGYAEDIFVKSYGSEREFNFLPKPFTLKQLASKVKEVMQK